MGKRFAIVIGVAAVGVMALGAQTAAAKTYNTRLLTTTWEGGAFWGRVESGDRKKCELGRRVTLFKKRPGADRKLGASRSDPKGGWSVRAPFEIGAGFYATVSPKVGDGFVCSGDRSPIYKACVEPCDQLPGSARTEVTSARLSAS